jgi:hypothetical protein
MVTIENQPSFGPVAKPEEKNDEEKDRKLMPNSAITVANGHLLWATHVDFMVKVLTGAADEGQLIKTTDYEIVKSELAKFAAPQSCAVAFSRTDEEYRAVYELVRTGRMPEAETMFGKVLNTVLGDGKQGVPRAQRIDGSKLPEYETVRRYFGPAGMTVVTEENGWFVTGFALSKQ